MITRDTALRGVFPIAPTPFTPTGELDLEGQRRVLDCMVDQGVDGICILANYSEQFLLSDEERETLMRLAKEVPAVRYFKIETQGAAAKLRGLIAAGGEAIAGPFDGEESITLMADLDAGATGTMPSALLPDLIKPVLTHHFAGRRGD